MRQQYDRRLIKDNKVDVAIAKGLIWENIIYQPHDTFSGTLLGCIMKMLSKWESTTDKPRTFYITEYELEVTLPSYDDGDNAAILTIREDKKNEFNVVATKTPSDYAAIIHIDEPINATPFAFFTVHEGKIVLTHMSYRQNLTPNLEVDVSCFTDGEIEIDFINKKKHYHFSESPITANDHVDLLHTYHKISQFYNYFPFTSDSNEIKSFMKAQSQYYSESTKQCIAYILKASTLKEAMALIDMYFVNPCIEEVFDNRMSTYSRDVLSGFIDLVSERFDYKPGLLIHKFKALFRMSSTPSLMLGLTNQELQFLIATRGSDRKQIALDWIKFIENKTRLRTFFVDAKADALK